MEDLGLDPRLSDTSWNPPETTVMFRLYPKMSINVTGLILSFRVSGSDESKDIFRGLPCTLQILPIMLHIGNGGPEKLSPLLRVTYDQLGPKREQTQVSVSLHHVMPP